MADGSVAHRAATLAWLSPSAPRLAALTSDSAAQFVNDPACLLLLLRFLRPSPTAESLSIADATFRQSSVLEAVATYLDTDGWCDPTQPEVSRILNYSRTIAAKAESLAAVSGTCPPAAARAAGLLAPFGWLAIATIDPHAAEACREKEDFATEPAIVESELLGMSVDALMRRLLHRWRLPSWLSNTLATLRLPLADAARLGADAALSKVVRFAIAAAESDYYGLIGPRLRSVLREIGEAPAAEFTSHGLAASADPRRVPLLKSLLTNTAQALRASGQSRVGELEARIDSLQSTLQTARDEFDIQLRDAKLAALAELAAGAGHEINNPLAVISGNAQWLRARESDESRQRSLDIIHRQTHRVADLLKDLMQYARPSAANPVTFAVNDLFHAVEREADPIAAIKAVSLRVAAATVHVTADPQQIRKAISNLVRNALDVTPTGGVVRLFSRVRGANVEIVVEDTGPGPAPEIVPHLFDPFYSGRDAGRGRGLGLSTAWQCAQQNNGTIRFDRRDDGPTRFILSLPQADLQPLAERQSA